MKNKKPRRESANSARASLRKEMEKPRMTRSARTAELKMDHKRIQERPSITLPGIVDQILKSPDPTQPEKANIAVDGPNHRFQDLRIQNTLIGEFGEDVKLKKGDEVEVSISGDPKTVDHHD